LTQKAASNKEYGPAVDSKPLKPSINGSTQAAGGSSGSVFENQIASPRRRETADFAVNSLK
jgi:hypothetical protein